MTTTTTTTTAPDGMKRLRLLSGSLPLAICDRLDLRDDHGYDDDGEEYRFVGLFADQCLLAETYGDDKASALAVDLIDWLLSDSKETVSVYLENLRGLMPLCDFADCNSDTHLRVRALRRMLEMERLAPRHSLRRSAISVLGSPPCSDEAYTGEFLLELDFRESVEAAKCDLLSMLSNSQEEIVNVDAREFWLKCRCANNGIRHFDVVSTALNELSAEKRVARERVYLLDDEHTCKQRGDEVAPYLGLAESMAMWFGTI